VGTTPRRGDDVPMGTNTAELYELHKITKLTVFYENERLVFITKIPLITDTELILYNAIPIPMVRTLNYGIQLIRD
jgi:hypothetical protein